MHKIDLSGLNCPQPVLHTKKYLAPLNSGEQVTIITTDPDSVKDLQIFCEKTKNIFVSQTIEQNTIITIIEKR